MPPDKPERAATLPLEPTKAQTVLLEGVLARKHDMEAPDKKAMKRSWNNLYCVLKPGLLSIYKDAKSYSHSVMHQEPLSLGNASWEILPNYKKKKHVCKLRLGDGNEYLFQCKDDEELQRWSQAMEKAVQPLGCRGGVGALRGQSPQPARSLHLLLLLGCPPRAQLWQERQEKEKVVFVYNQVRASFLSLD
ncbi:Spectrin beta chain, non-erythrocytic 1 [Larimichthys crocea]|uniref:Uncharacterized protein n=1 Tax=Larimichthys crocea TaxID=215358 RepID=A0ACD3RQL6_LARCR|nr:Spectrin beta chain, non-erythrocytic 1 [Larimichthys crocea]